MSYSPLEWKYKMATIKQGTILYTAILWLVGTGVVVQLWLVTAAMDALLSHEKRILLPTALGSLLIFILNAAMLQFVFSFDKKINLKSDS